VLCEAAACGRPVITTNTPGCSDAVIHEKTGFLVPTHDASAIAQRLEYLYNNNSLLEKMSNDSRKYAVDNYNINNIVNLHITAYFDLLQDLSK